MPQHITPIEKVTQAKDQSVLFIQFHRMNDCDELGRPEKGGYGTDGTRQQVLDWLDENQIGWSECGAMAVHNGMLFIGFVGDVYVDVPYDESNQQYRHLRDFLENPDGTMRDENIRFYCLSVPFDAGRLDNGAY